MRRLVGLWLGLWGLMLICIYGVGAALPTDVLIFDGRVGRANGEIYVTDTRGRFLPLTRTQAMESSPTWSPDGTRLAFVTRGTTTGLYLLDWANLATAPVANSSADYHDPVWSPDGKQLAYRFAPERGAQSEIFTYDVETGELRNLTESGERLAYSGVQPIWSPRGDMLLYINSLTRRVVVARLPYGEIVLQTPADINAPTWSPDGTRIAYLRPQSNFNPNVVNTIAIQSVDEPEQVQTITPSVTEETRVLSWSPDGRYLAFAGRVPGRTGFNNRNGFFLPYEQIFLADLETGDITPLAEITGFVWGQSMSWSPDAARLAFTMEQADAPRLCFARVATGAYECYAEVIGSETDWQPSS